MAAGESKPMTMVVRYTGSSDVRAVSVAQFELAEVTDQRSDLVWNSWNGRTIEVEGNISDSALDLLLSQGDEFVLEEVDADGSGDGDDGSDSNEG